MLLFLFYLYAAARHVSIATSEHRRHVVTNLGIADLQPLHLAGDETRDEFLSGQTGVRIGCEHRIQPLALGDESLLHSHVHRLHWTALQ